MELAHSPREVIDLFNSTLQEIDGVYMPVEDTLNIKNGLNYAQFLEAILRIAYYRSDNEGIPYKTSIESIFQDADIHINKRQLEDPVLLQIYSEETANEFEQKSELLQSIFSKRALNRDATYLEMDKNEFILLLKDTGIVSVPKKKEETKANDPKKKKQAEEEKKDEPAEVIALLEEDAHEAIEMVCSFEDEKMNYFNFLECLVRISRVYKFSAEQEATLTTGEAKLCELLDKMDTKYGDLVDQFYGARREIEATKFYQPRLVVDESQEQSDQSDDM